MFQLFYTKFIFKYPKGVLSAVLAFILILAFFATKLEIDASSETLLLEDDTDLQFAREIGKRYATSDVLIVTFSPKQGDLLSSDSLNDLEQLSQELMQLPMTASVTSVLNVPLLQASELEITSLVDGIPTLQKSTIEKSKIKKEFLNSPLYKQNLVSKDFKTTALLINLKPNLKYFKLLNQRNTLIKKQKETTLSKVELESLSHIKKAFKTYRDKYRIKEHDNIESVRTIIKKYDKRSTLFLGGVSMIADDIVGFVRNDLMVYGSTLIALLILILWVIFRQLRWVLLPVLICTFSVIATAGALGYFGWEITVISSNFIAMQLIITISIVLHLIVRYRELSLKYTHANQSKLVVNTMLSKLNPSFFAIITTIAGFSSLVFSNIQPVIQLGWMMSVGIALSLLIAFIVFPAVLIQLPVIKPNVKFENDMKLTTYCAYLVQFKGKRILISTILFVILALMGASQLIVENSFINYFKSNTEIYKGMEVIDTKLGGTTPLDVIVTFAQEEVEEAVEEEGDEFDSFDDEFDASENDEKYWFTQEKMQKIKQVHEYLLSQKEIGNVQSFGTLLQVGKTINKNKEMDSVTLGLLYNKIPEEYKSLILSPYINLEANQVRFATRIIDSNENLRRDELLTRINTDLKTLLPNDTVRLSNLMVLYNNMLQSLFDSQIKTLGFVILILFVMFVVLFRSAKLAFIAIVSNIVPIGIIFAVMGFGHIPLDIMTITIAAISIGIGVDDTIHYIHRFKEEFKKDHDYINVMKRSHNSIGYAMTYTSLAVMVGFSILVLSNLIPTIYFGLLTVVVMVTILASALLLLPYLIIVLKPLKTPIQTK